MSYELLSHPADVRFRATGPTLEAAFAEAVRAFADVSESHGGTDVRHAVHVESEDREALLFDFVAQLILLQEVEAVAVTRADSLEITAREGGYDLDASILGGPIEGTLFDVKSPTYSEMRVEETDDGWVLETTLDI
ncbi:archease [Halomarina salina]|uniref:Archease n=1 Tax=Halomarina salina TaxID=1872699 RepID=A0ABD5RPR5_9EURY|nr:archease [Halomarina salina]